MHCDLDGPGFIVEVASPVRIRLIWGLLVSHPVGFLQHRQHENGCLLEFSRFFLSCICSSDPESVLGLHGACELALARVTLAITIAVADCRMLDPRNRPNTKSI